MKQCDDASDEKIASAYFRDELDGYNWGSNIKLCLMLI